MRRLINGLVDLSRTGLKTLWQEVYYECDLKVNKNSLIIFVKMGSSTLIGYVPEYACHRPHQQ